MTSALWSSADDAAGEQAGYPAMPELPCLLFVAGAFVGMVSGLS